MPRLSLPYYKPTWGSHLPVLAKIFDMSSGPILELGIGVFSTPFLHIMCEAKKRKLVSYEDNPNFVNSHRAFVSDTHQLYMVEDWDDIAIDGDFWDVVFIDGPADRRLPEAKRVAQKANFVILHDTEPNRREEYVFSEIHKMFKYSFDYTDLQPNTSVFSNFVDITNLKI